MRKSWFESEATHLNYMKILLLIFTCTLVSAATSTHEYITIQAEDDSSITVKELDDWLSRLKIENSDINIYLTVVDPKTKHKYEIRRLN